MGNVIISIRCLAYNHENFIRKCLDGFVMQKTKFSFEAIVHDDASTDNTARIIKEYAEKYPQIIKPIFEKENQHSKYDGSINRIMVSACTGKYIALCEGDDYWTDPYKLQRQVDYMEEHPDCMLTFHRAKVMDEMGTLKNFDLDEVEERDYSSKELFSKWIVPTASMVVRNVVYHYPNKYRAKILNGDILTYLTAAKMGKVHGFSDVMSVYRVHSGGVSHNPSLKKERTMLMAYHYIALLKLFPEIDGEAIRNGIATTLRYRISQDVSPFSKLKDFLLLLRYNHAYLFNLIKSHLRSK